MTVHRAESRLLSNLGGVDRGSIWTFEIPSGRVGSVRLGEGDFVRLLPGQEGLFAAQLVSHKRSAPWLSSRSDVPVHRPTTRRERASTRKIKLAGEPTASD